MTNDNKPLADVQPGGRVRLGDQAALKRLHAHLTAYPPPCNPEDVAVLGAALSAQPSPGGQGDALHDAVGRIFGCDGSPWRTRDVATVLREYAAIAARQPVGEPADAIDRIALLLYLRSCNRRADGMPMQEWGPMDEHLKDYYRRDARNYEALRNTALWPAGRENYAAPTAQAVDLGAVRALLQRRIEQWRSHLPADPGAPAPREIETKGEHDYNNDVRIYREGIAVMEEVLSKIDSQAVGNG